jgi:preprotein translocase subunit SecG
MTIIISLACVISVLLVLVVLAQNAKGGGLSSQFGGSGASNLIGVKKTGDLLERLTWGFAITLIILSLMTNLVTPGGGNDILERAGQQGGTFQQAPPIQEPSPTPADTAN